MVTSAPKAAQQVMRPHAVRTAAPQTSGGLQLPEMQTGLLQRMANEGPQCQRLAQLQAKANRHPIAPPSGPSAPVQLRKLKDAEVRRLIKDTAKTSQPNKTAILLALYNEMRHEIDPTPGPFTSLATARAAMIKADRIDAEDAAALDDEATRMQTAGGDPAEAMRLRITAAIAAQRAGFEAKYAHHIFQGDMKDGVPTGFHSKIDGSATHEAYGTQTDVGNAGAYQQSVRRANNGTRKPIQSTFFPDNATHDQIIDALTVVYGYGLSTVAYVGAPLNGMRLAKRGDTIFPAGGSDTRNAE